MNLSFPKGPLRDFNMTMRLMIGQERRRYAAFRKPNIT